MTMRDHWQLEILLSGLVVLFSTLLIYVLINQRQREMRRSVALKMISGEVEKPEAPLVLQQVGHDLPLRDFFHKRKLQQEIDLYLPNALDLMRVCVDAGLDLNGSMARVAHELAGSSPTLARMFRDLQLQLKAGASAEQAFRVLVEETGSFEIRNLMTSLAEAEQLGSSVSLILRTYATELRNRHRIAAEEKGAKLPTKLLFPLLVCLFPAMMIVLVGPSILGALELLKGFQ